MPRKIKIGIIGCGYIAHFHVQVFKKLNCYINSVSSRDNKSKNLIKFAKKYNINNIYSSSIEHIIQNKWDALLICCKQEYLLKSSRSLV